MYKPFTMDEGFVNAIRQAVTSPSLEFVFALLRFFDDGTS